MATYNYNLTLGTKGDNVRQLQQALSDKGYNIGAAGVSGNYDADTEAAVKKFQQDNGLEATGIGEETTLNKLYAPAAATTETASTAAAAAAPAAKPSVTPVGSAYDPLSDAAYQQALAALQTAEKNAPVFANTYDAQLQDLYSQIVNRDKFSYDVNSDALYRQYRDQYVQQGKMAMMDTAGQAAALTGGYGNSYAQSVGQQQYNAYLQQLTSEIPELYSAAYGQYKDEGDQMLQQYAMMGDLADNEYAKYQDAYNQWLTERDYAQKRADTAYNRGYTSWENSYKVQQQNREDLIYLINATGYNPSDDELTAAGMTRAQANALISAYNDAIAAARAASYSYGGGGGYSGGGYSGGGSSGSSSSKLSVPTVSKKSGVDMSPKVSAAQQAAYNNTILGTGAKTGLIVGDKKIKHSTGGKF